MKTKTNVTAGSLTQNYSQSGVRVKSAVKAGALVGNHNQTC